MNLNYSRSIVVIATVLALLVAAGSAQAQVEKRFGFFGGLNFANQGGDMEELGDGLAAEFEDMFGGTWTAEKSANSGLGIGGYLLTQRSPTVGIQFEAQYIRRGAKIELTGAGLADDLTATAEFQVDYLEVPILARFSPSPGATFQPIFLAGPVVGFKLGANLAVTAESGGESDEESMDISEGYQDITVGLLGGAGFTVGIGATSHLVVQARYYLGLTNALDDPDFEAKSGDFGVFAGLEFARN